MQSRKLILIGIFFISCLMNSLHAQNFIPVLYGQNHKHTENKKASSILELCISYNEKIPLEPYLLKEWEMATWTIQGENEFSQSGNNIQALCDFIFTLPGNYDINIYINPSFTSSQQEGACFHPTDMNRINLTVSPFKLTFVHESVNLSEKISPNRETHGILLSVNVVLESFDGSVFTYDKVVRAAGVETDILGTLREVVNLNPGINTLTFQLSGKVTHPNTYISFDFLDPTKGFLWSYPLMNPIL